MSDEAGFVTRLWALLVDAVIVSLSLSTTTLLLTHSIGLFRPDHQDISLSSSFLGALASVGTLVYFVGPTAWLGQTPGKWLAGIRVVGPNGETPSLIRSLARFGGYFISAAPLYLGFVWVLVSPHRRGWHDILARTRVLYVRPKAEALQKLPEVKPPRRLQ